MSNPTASDLSIVPPEVVQLSEQIAERTATVRDRLDRSAGPDVSLLAVSKAHPPTTAWAAALAGHSDLGENYAQELTAKAEFLEERGVEVRWHMIGPVQSNKVKLLAPVLGWWHTVDRPKLVRGIANHSPGATVLIQRNLSGDPNKAGCATTEVEPLLGLASEAGLNVAGLMGVATDGPLDQVAAEFESLVLQADELGLPERCIGMSADFDVAVAAGATMVRLGSMLFGSRPGSAYGGPSRA